MSNITSKSRNVVTSTSALGKIETVQSDDEIESNIKDKEENVAALHKRVEVLQEQLTELRTDNEMLKTNHECTVAKDSVLKVIAFK